MVLLLAMDNGIVDKLMLFDDEDIDKAEKVQIEIAENDCFNPSEQYVSLYSIESNGEQAELICTLPEEED
jgi:hypothetical protein